MNSQAGNGQCPKCQNAHTSCCKVLRTCVGGRKAFKSARCCKARLSQCAQYFEKSLPDAGQKKSATSGCILTQPQRVSSRVEILPSMNALPAPVDSACVSAVERKPGAAAVRGRGCEEQGPEGHFAFWHRHPSCRHVQGGPYPCRGFVWRWPCPGELTSFSMVPKPSAAQPVVGMPHFPQVTPTMLIAVSRAAQGPCGMHGTASQVQYRNHSWLCSMHSASAQPKSPGQGHMDCMHAPSICVQDPLHPCILAQSQATTSSRHPTKVLAKCMSKHCRMSWCRHMMSLQSPTAASIACIQRFVVAPCRCLYPLPPWHGV